MATEGMTLSTALRQKTLPGLGEAGTLSDSRFLDQLILLAEEPFSETEPWLASRMPLVKQYLAPEEELAGEENLRQEFGVTGVALNDACARKS